MYQWVRYAIYIYIFIKDHIRSLIYILNFKVIIKVVYQGSYAILDKKIYIYIAMAQFITPPSRLLNMYLNFNDHCSHQI